MKPTQKKSNAKFSLVDLAFADLNGHLIEDFPPVSGSFHFINAYSLYCASLDVTLLDVYQNEGSTLFVDSHWLSQALGSALNLNVSQTRGPTFFKTAIASWDRSHFFLGTTPETLGRLISNAKLLNPAIDVAGSYSPPFGPVTAQTIEKIDVLIENLKPDVIWVGLGTPKQDFETLRLASKFGTSVFAVGAAFDFLAGTVNEAPLVLRKIGLEWFYRLIKEPGRLWRRYLLGNTYFIFLSLRTWWHAISHRSNP